MNVIVTDYLDVETRALELRLQPPGLLAILPRGFDAGSAEPPAHESQSATIRKLLKERGVDSRECSICGACYEECDHIAGRAYGGKLCAPIVREFLELHEVSIVPEPADKRCRVTHFSDSGKSRNKMTWRLESRTRSIAHQTPKNIGRKRPSNRISRG